jgi:hypothetical protein
MLPEPDMVLAEKDRGGSFRGAILTGHGAV